MRQGLKIAISLLIALVVFGAFAVVSFTGFFHTLETTFFRPRVLSAREGEAGTYASAVEAYHEANIERFSTAAAEAFVISAFRANQNQLDIFNRENYFGKLLEDYPSIQAIRVLGADGEKVHYSTVASDLSASAPTQRKYQDLSKVDTSLPTQELRVEAGTSARLIIDAQNGRFVYVVPVAADGSPGSIVFYVGRSGLSNALLNRPELDFRTLFLVEHLGIVINSPVRNEALIAEQIAPLWQKSAAEPALETLTLRGRDGEEALYGVVSRAAGRFGFVALLVPVSAFELQPLMKGVLLAAVFLTVFLILFLVLNVRQDPLVVLSQRVKRFQLEVLQEFIDGKQRIDWQRWRRELIANRAELKSRFKRGVGRLPTGQEVELDGLIDRSWDEIIGIIDARLGEVRAQPVDLRSIEQLLQRALEQGSITIASERKATASPRALAEPPPPPGDLVVEEIGIDEVVEASAGGAETVAARAAQAPGGAVEEPAEALEEAEAEPIEALEEPEALEEVEELAEAEPAEALEEAEAEPAEALEEPEALEEVEELAETLEEPGTELPDLGREVSIGAEEEIEEIGDAEVAEELRAMEPLPAAEPTPLEQVAPGAAPDESLEELEGVREIKTLPPLPQEVLEELPEVPEEQGRREKRKKAAAAPAPAPVLPGRKPPVATRGPAEEPEDLEEVGEAEELEALEEVGEAEELAAVAGSDERELVAREAKGPSAAAEKRQLEVLLRSGKLETYSLKDIEQKIIESRTSVVMENGVFRVKEELYAGGRGRKTARGLRARAESVLSAVEEGERESGIGSLFGEDVLLDLDKEISTSSTGEVELLLGGRQRSRRIQYFDNGLDYDSYLRGFGARKSVTQRLKSLVELSGKLRAVNAAIFGRQDDRYSLSFKVGLLDDPVAIDFAGGEFLYDQILKPRKAALVRERPEKLHALASKFNPDDLRYLQAAIFVPIIYESAEAYLYLGLPDEKQCDLSNIISRLDIY